MIKGLPYIDTPLHERDPHDCRRCVHSFYHVADDDRRYLRCARSAYRQQCRYERHYSGECTEAALHFKAREA